MIWQCYKLRLSLSANLVTDWTALADYNAQLFCEQLWNGELTQGLAIAISRSVSTGQTTVSGIGWTHTMTSASTVSAVIELTDVKLLSANTLTAATATFSVGGTVRKTYTNWTWTKADANLTAGVGGIAIGPTIKISSFTPGAGPAFPSSPAMFSEHATSHNGTLTLSGGLDFKLASTDSWSTLPGILPTIPSGAAWDTGAVPRQYSLSLPAGSATITNSANLSVSQSANGSAEYIYTGGYPNGWFVMFLDSARSGASELTFISNEKPVLNRFNDPFSLRLARKAVPTVEAMGQAGAANIDTHPAYGQTGTVGAEQWSTILTALSARTEDIGQTAHEMETEYLQRDHPSFVRVLCARSYYAWEGHPRFGGDGDAYKSEGMSWQYPRRLAGTVTNADTIKSRHVDEIEHRWNAYNTAAFDFTYFTPQSVTYSQHHRLFKLSDGRVGDILLGAHYQPGICHATTNDASTVSSIAMNSGSGAMIRAIDGTRSLSGTISVSGQELEIDLTSTTVAPFLYGMLANRIQLIPVSGTGLTYWLVDADGNKLQVTPVSNIITIPPHNSPKFTFQSGARDWGRGLVSEAGGGISEYFPDVASNGISPSLYNARDTIQSSRQFDGGWQKLVVKTTGFSMVLNYPRFYRDSLTVIPFGPDEFLFRNGHRFAFLRASFPTIGTVGLEKPGLPARIGDWLHWKRWVLEGKSHNTATSVANESVSLNAPTEGQTYNNMLVSDFRQFAKCYIMPSGSGRLIKGWRNQQPNPRCLFRTLDANLAQTSTASSNRWEYGTLKHRTLGVGVPLDVWNGTTKLTSVDAVADGIHLSSYEHNHNFSAGPDETLKTGDKRIADVRAIFSFQGYSGGVSTNEKIHMCRHHNGFLYGVIADGESLDIFECNSDNKWSRWTYLNESIPCASIAQHPNGGLVLAYENVDGNTQFVESQNFGRTWGDGTMITDAQAVAIAIDPASGVQYAAIWRSDSYECYRKLTDTASWVLRGTICTTTDKSAALEVSPESSNCLVAVVQVADDVVRYVSLDGGLNWTLA